MPKRAQGLVALVVAALALWWYLNPSARPVMVADALDELAAEPRETRLYRWRDDDGAWVVADAPPKDGREYEVVDYDYDANVVPSVLPDD